MLGASFQGQFVTSPDDHILPVRNLRKDRMLGGHLLWGLGSVRALQTGKGASKRKLISIVDRRLSLPITDSTHNKGITHLAFGKEDAACKK